MKRAMTVLSNGCQAKHLKFHEKRLPAGYVLFCGSGTNTRRSALSNPQKEARMSKDKKPQAGQQQPNQGGSNPQEQQRQQQNRDRDQRDQTAGSQQPQRNNDNTMQRDQDNSANR
jgi:hypothetical protein